MKVNLKKLRYQLNTLDMVSDDIKKKRFVATTPATAKDLSALCTLLEEVYKDLSLAGESIVELDKSRAEALKEANENQS